MIRNKLKTGLVYAMQEFQGCGSNAMILLWLLYRYWIESLPSILQSLHIMEKKKSIYLINFGVLNVMKGLLTGQWCGVWCSAGQKDFCFVSVFQLVFCSGPVFLGVQIISHHSLTRASIWPGPARCSSKWLELGLGFPYYSSKAGAIELQK